MKYLAKHLDLPARIQTTDPKLKSVSSQIISQHTQAIFKQCQQPTEGLIKQFGKLQFWHELKKETKHRKQINKLYHLWKKVEPLAHLDTKQLLSLLEVNVFPLERSYQHLVFHFPEHLVVKQAKKNLDRINKLKKLIYSNLYVRAQAYQMLKAPRNVDDVLSVISYQLNSFKIFTTPLKLNQPLSATCDDDKRIVIYHRLKMAGYSSKELDKVIAPISRQTVKLSKMNTDNKAQLKKMNQFRNKQIQALDLAGFIQNKSLSSQNKDKKQSAFQSMIKKSNDFIAQGFNQLGLKSLLDQLYQFRFVFYFMFSLLVYSIVLLAIQPLIFSIASWISLETISSVLFYSIGMMPLWIFSANFFMKLGTCFRDYVCFWKKQEILDGLIVMEDLQHFMADKLTHYILDVSHCDIRDITSRAQQHHESLMHIQAKLNRRSISEKWFFRSNMVSVIRRMKAKMHTQELQFKKALKKMAHHIALRVGQDIRLLDVALTNKELLPIISFKQLARLKKFIIEFGDQKTLELFSKNTQLQFQWIDKVIKNQFLHPILQPRPMAIHVPWGKHDLQHNALKGWQTLLRIFTSDPKKRQACLKLNAVLTGKKAMSANELDLLINQLDCTPHSAALKKQIQSCIFKTLDCRDPSHAQFLSAAQKEQIVNIYLNNKREIIKANLFVEKLFSTQPCQEKILFEQTALVGNLKICRYVELLDIQLIYYHAIGESERLQNKQNQFRSYFTTYEGQNSFAYQLIEFFPRKEQTELITFVAKKRLGWIIDHISRLSSHPWKFSSIDKALFNDYLLHKNDNFDFAEEVRHSSIFHQPWAPQVAQFLKLCHQCGLDSGELYRRYQAKRAMQQKLILVQQALDARKVKYHSQPLSKKEIISTNRKCLYA